MAVNRGNHPDLLAVGFRKLLFDEYGRYPEQYGALFNVESSSKAFEEDSALWGFGNFPEKAEGAAITYDDPIQGYQKKYTHRTFAMGFQVTHEMLADDQHRKMQAMPKSLGTSLRNTIETDAVTVYDNAFTTAGPDGQALCSAVHPRVDGGSTQSNTVAADLSYTALEQANIDIAAWTDDRGILINVRPRTLVISPDVEWSAKRILQSVSPSTVAYVGQTGTSPASSGAPAAMDTRGGTDVNPAQGTLEIVVNNYKTAKDDWFILCDRHDVNFFWREKPSFDRDNHFDTKNLRFSSMARWSHGFTDWRGVYGSTG